MSLDLYERSFCECRACSFQCRVLPGTCAPGDVERILTSLGCDPADLDDVASYFMADDDNSGVEVIRPKQLENGNCVFYDEGRCLIYRNRPFGCSRALICQESFLEPLNAVAEAVRDAEAYQDLVAQLHQLGNAPPLYEERIEWIAELFGIVPNESDDSHE